MKASNFVWVHRFDEEIIQERVKSAQRFIDFVAGNKALFLGEEFKEFCEVRYYVSLLGILPKLILRSKLLFYNLSLKAIRRFKLKLFCISAYRHLWSKRHLQSFQLMVFTLDALSWYDEKMRC